MSEQAPDTKQTHEFPKDVRELHSPDGTVALYASPYGGQVWAGEIDGEAVIFPLEERHSIAKDTRPINPNDPNVGETKAPGGTWPSFGRKGPVHGPFSGPSFQFATERDETTDSRLVMTGRPGGRTEDFFDPGEAYLMRRVVEARDGSNGGRGSISLRTTITNQSDRSVDMPEATEHLYLVGGPGSGILNREGTLTPPEVLPRPLDAKPNSNAIDTRISSTLTGTPGEVAFMPEGEGGRVVVVRAQALRANGDKLAIDEFCVYRFQQDDPWTAIEPTLNGVHLEHNEAVTMDVEILTFDSLEAYRARQVAGAGREPEAAGHVADN